MAVVGWLLLLRLEAAAQTLNVPPRPADAPTGSQLARIFTPMSLTERENWIFSQVVSGNVPDFLRRLAPITVSATINGTAHSATYYVIPDYTALGTDGDYLLEPMTPILAQRLCDRLGYTLPTRKMVNQIWTNAAVKLAPQPIPPSGEMITVPVFADHNSMIWTQRSAYTNSFPLGALVAGDKKDVVISTMIYSNLHSGVPKPVVIYGWHYQDGNPIQPLYNGHEETYADYSHGVRLVQSTMILDGTPTTVSNVLRNPSLAALLSDEGPSQGTTSSGIIPLPRYSIAPVAPVVISHPRSQSVLPGANLALRVLAAGDAPLAYLWKFNGIPIPGATNPALCLSNAQPAHAGSYQAVVTNAAGAAMSRIAALRLKTNVHPLLFSDVFSTNTSGSWNLFWGASNGAPDYTATWSFDHGAIPYTFNGATALIPPAPNSPDESAKSVRFSVNNNDTTGATAAVNIYPAGQFFSNNFALKFDLWINYPGAAGGVGSTGSTEFGIWGINHLGTQANWAAPSAASSDGLWFGADGEGGASADYRAYVGNPSGTQIDLTAAGTSGLSASNNSAASYQTLFPAARFETAGAPGKNWVEVELRQTNNLVFWLMDGTVIAQRPNASSFTSGNIMVGYMDPFASIASPERDAFVLFDNVRVEDLGAPALQPPGITSQPAHRSVAAGETAVFGVNASGSGPLNYQWRLNGTNLPGATASALAIASVQPSDAGSYDVLVSNPAGLAASAPALLLVNAAPVRFISASVLSGGLVQLIFSGATGEDYILEASTNLANWKPVGMLVRTSGPLPFVDSDATNFTRRFYRARLAAW